MNQAARVVGALLERPRLLGAVLRLLGVPCEGFQGVCHQSATVITNSQTCYDPSERKDARPGDLGRNRDYFFCPQCSEAYTEMMDDQWADYYSGRL